MHVNIEILIKKGIKFLLYSFFTLLITINAFGQNKIKIETADKLYFDKKQGNAQKLLGNVKFRHNKAVMFCDSAYFYSDSNKVDAFGHIHIIENDTMHLYGDTLHYFGNSQIVNISGNVLMQTNSIRLKTSALTYNRKQNIAYYYGGGEIIHKKENLNLKGDIGTYNVGASLFSFKRNVTLTHPDFTLQADTFQYQYSKNKAIFISPTHIQLKDSIKIYTEKGWYLLKQSKGKYFFPTKIVVKNKEIVADTLFINQKENWAYGISNMKITDTANALILGAQYGYVNHTSDSVFLSDLPYLQQFKDSDTLTFIADTIIIKQKKDTLKNDSVNNSKRYILAYHHVAFFKKDLQGKCDSLVYHSTDSLLHLYKKPIVWSGINQMTADSISLKIYEGNIQQLVLKQNAFICSLVDSTLDFYDQISGKNMYGYFRENKLTKVFVNKNAQTLYYSEDDKRKYIGVNKAFAANLEIRFKNEKIHRIVYLSKPSAKFIPINKLPVNEKFFKGFNWQINHKPDIKLLQDRLITDKLREF
jgi:lipopolysaccharide export system protein LptA